MLNISTSNSGLIGLDSNSFSSKKYLNIATYMKYFSIADCISSSDAHSMPSSGKSETDARLQGNALTLSEFLVKVFVEPSKGKLRFTGHIHPFPVIPKASV